MLKYSSSFFLRQFFTRTIHLIYTFETTNVSTFQEIRIFIFGERDRFSVFRKIPSIVSREKTSREKEEDSSLSGNFLARLQYLLRFSYTCFSPASIKATQLLSLSLSPVHFSREHLGHLARAIKNERLSRGVAGGRVGAHELPLINQLSPRHFPLTSLAFPPNRKRGNGQVLARMRREREREDCQGRRNDLLSLFQRENVSRQHYCKLA